VTGSAVKPFASDAVETCTRAWKVTVEGGGGKRRRSDAEGEHDENETFGGDRRHRRGA
jgi:hypothetical protein